MATRSNSYADYISFEKTKAKVEFPDLLGVQIDAFQSFIQEHAPNEIGSHIKEFLNSI